MVVLPVPFTPTTRITLGLLRQVQRARVAEELGDLLRERVAEVAELAAGLEPAHELGGRAHADVALDQRLLEPLPGLLVAGVEGGGGELACERAAALAERVAQPAEEALRSSSVSCGPSASPSSSAQLLRHRRGTLACAGR